MYSGKCTTETKTECFPPTHQQCHVAEGGNYTDSKCGGACAPAPAAAGNYACQRQPQCAPGSYCSPQFKRCFTQTNVSCKQDARACAQHSLACSSLTHMCNEVAGPCTPSTACKNTQVCRSEGSSKGNISWGPSTRSSSPSSNACPRLEGPLVADPFALGCPPGMVPVLRKCVRRKHAVGVVF